MFESPGSREVTPVEPLLDDVAGSDWPDALRGHHTRIAREQFREIDASATLYFVRCGEDVSRGVNPAHVGDFVHIEVAGTLRITEWEANRMIDLGVDLRLRLHRTARAFAAGLIDLGKAQAICGVLANVSDDKLDEIESRLLDGAEGKSRNKLKAKARRLIDKHDPDAARKRRESAQDERGVWLTADEDGMVELSGTLPAASGQVLGMRLRAMSFQVCAGDPRTPAARRADAITVLAGGGERLECQCGLGAGCPKSRATVVGGSPADHSETSGSRVGVSGPSADGSTGNLDEADSATTTDSAAASDGATAADSARDVAADDVAAVKVAGSGMAGGDGDTCATHAPAADESDAECHSPGGVVGGQTTILVGVNAATLLGLDDLPGHLHGHGSIDAAHARELSTDATWRQVLTLTETDRERLVESLIESLIHAGFTINGPDPTNSDPSGDFAERVGGHRVDPSIPGPILGVGRALAAAGITASALRNRSKSQREELTYRPSARLVRIVQTRDGTCRFPNCTERAENCDLDHTIPFNRSHPELGGPTTELNLACLCRKHHRLKTQGYWKVRQIGGGRLEWTDPHGEKLVTVPGGAFCDPDAHDESGPGDRAANAPLTGRARTEADLAAHGIDPSVLTDDATIRRLFEDARSPITNDLEYLLDLNAPRRRELDLDRVIGEFQKSGGDYVDAGRFGRVVTVDRFSPQVPRRPWSDEPPPF